MISCWRNALSALRCLGQDKSFNAGLVRCSVAHVLLMARRETDGAYLLQEARSDMESEARIYWIPIFNSYWHDYITKATQGL